MPSFSYLLSRAVKYLHFSTVQDSRLENHVRISPECTVIGTSMGRYSYCGARCTLINCEVGRYCSIAEDVSAGLASHPAEWVSTSPAFHLCAGRSVSREMAALHYPLEKDIKNWGGYTVPRTKIGHDVWIGKNVLIKSGVEIGSGAIIGMGSVVTHDVPPYMVAAGNPARILRPRFPAELAERLLASRWWNLEPDVLKKYSGLVDEPEKFLTVLEEDL